MASAAATTLLYRHHGREGRCLPATDGDGAPEKVYRAGRRPPRSFTLR